MDYNPSGRAVTICGLDAPEAAVEITYTAGDGGESVLGLTVGARVPDRSGRYTQVDGDSTIYLVRDRPAGPPDAGGRQRLGED